MPRLDPADTEHRRALHRWLNSWGCRIRYPQPGEPDLFDVALAEWWTRRRRALGAVREPLAQLTDHHVRVLVGAFDDLRASVVAPRRTLGSTAAAKCLYVLLPRTVMPWDQAIAEHLHGGRDGVAFAAHLALGRRWAAALLAEAGTGEDDVVDALGRPGSSLARVLDEHCYVTFTLDTRP